MTLAVYGFQCIAYVIIIEYLNKNKIDIPHNYVTPTIVTLLILLLCVFIIKLCKLNKYSSLFFLGKYPRDAKVHVLYPYAPADHIKGAEEFPGRLPVQKDLILHQ